MLLTVSPATSSIRLGRISADVERGRSFEPGLEQLKTAYAWSDVAIDTAQHPADGPLSGLDEIATALQAAQSKPFPADIAREHVQLAVAQLGDAIELASSRDPYDGAAQLRALEATQDAIGAAVTTVQREVEGMRMYDGATSE
jgi:hypothetical protein